MKALSLAFYIDSVPFTRSVIDGTASLGGSESACLGVARGLAARGHHVHLYVTKLAPEAAGLDHAGVHWHPFQDFSLMSQYIEWDCFCSLRMAQFFAGDLINARTRWLWNQDLLVGEGGQNLVMASMYQVDRLLYVSAYHRHQWEAQLPCLAPFGHVIRNGYDASLVPDPATVVKRPTRLIHISRPERGLRPLLAMWPAVRAARPDAELAICRYSSMYDAHGWGKICASYDDEMRRVHEAVGGIIELGELGKPALYQAIAEAAVMWYPGIASFAETSCIAAIEAQACGTPFVGSWKGALPETVPCGTLIQGDAESEAYQRQSVQAVLDLMRGCERQTRDYRERQAAGRQHVTAYTYTACAQDWEAFLLRELQTRAVQQRSAVVARLLHDDDPVAALAAHPPEIEAAWAQHIIDGKDQTAEDYSDRALQDPMAEVAWSDRLRLAAQRFSACAHVLDVACGNGAGALALLAANPHVRVHGLDYAQHNIEQARAAVAQHGYEDRATFECLTVYDFSSHTLHADMRAWLERHAGAFDGLFVGEFLEHVQNIPAVVDGLEQALTPGATVVYTMPNGPFTELMERGIPIKRGHVHRFANDDIQAVFGEKRDCEPTYLAGGFTARGRPVGHWLVVYAAGTAKAGTRDVTYRAESARPYPRLSVGIIAKNAEKDLARCLESVWPIADEIIIGDTGSTDSTATIAAAYGASVLPLKPVEAYEGGFSEARNLVLQACRGEWFLWIDADEQLIGVQHLAKYLDPGGPYQGYVIRQQHLYIDLPSSYDIPVRLFRRIPEIKFYGCVHEQPAYRDANTELFPTLELRDVVLAHTGYLTEDVRKTKMLKRNLPLLKRDALTFPTRELGKVLILRDLVNVAETEREERGGWSDENVRWLMQAVGLFEAKFADPAHRYHGIARPWYERALRGLMSVGAVDAWEMEAALAGKSGGLGKAHAAPERIWVRSMADYQRYVDFKVQQLTKASQAPVIDCEPIVRTVQTVAPALAPMAVG